jgi:hypothetical protein
VNQIPAQSQSIPCKNLGLDVSRYVSRRPSACRQLSKSAVSGAVPMREAATRDVSNVRAGLPLGHLPFRQLI